MAEFGATVRESNSSVVQQSAENKPSNVKFGGRLPVDQTATDPAAALREGITLQMNDILQEKDPNVRLEKISQMSTAARRKQSEILERIATRVKDESQIPILEQKLKEVRNQGFAGRLLDGAIQRKLGGLLPEQSLRNALQEERAAVQQKIKLEISTNPDIASVEAIHDTFGFLNTQTRKTTAQIGRQEADEIRDENKEDDSITRAMEAKVRITEARIAKETAIEMQRDSSKQLFDYQTEIRREDKKEAKEEKRVDLLNALSQPQIEAARIISGKSEKDNSIGDYIILNSKNKDFSETMANIESPDAILRLSLEGNSTAQGFLMKKQAEVLAGTSDRTDPRYIKELAVAKNDVREMTRVMTSPSQLEVAKDRVYGMKGSSKRTNYDNNNQLRTLALGTREAAAENLRIRAELAGDFLATVNRETFVGNLDSWGDQYTAALGKLPTYLKLAQDKGKGNVKLDDMIQSITAIEDPEIKAQELAKFETIMSAAAANKNKAYFGFALDNLGVRSAIERSVVRSLRGDLQDATLPIARTLVNPTGVAIEYIKDTYKEIDDKFDITDYIFGK